VGEKLGVAAGREKIRAKNFPKYNFPKAFLLLESYKLFELKIITKIAHR
jgi:hypothetical protein